MTADLHEPLDALLRRQRDTVERRLRVVLAAHGVDPDDRTDGWESRARAVLGNLKVVETVDISDDYRMTVTTEIRPKQP